MCGVYTALCLPWSRRAASVAIRPRTIASASMTCHSRATLPALGTNEPMRSSLAFTTAMGDRGATPAVSLVQRTANQEDNGDYGHCQAACRLPERAIDHAFGVAEGVVRQPPGLRFRQSLTKVSIGGVDVFGRVLPELRSSSGIDMKTTRGTTLALRASADKSHEHSKHREA